MDWLACWLKQPCLTLHLIKDMEFAFAWMFYIAHWSLTMARAGTKPPAKCPAVNRHVIQRAMTRLSISSICSHWDESFGSMASFILFEEDEIVWMKTFSMHQGEHYFLLLIQRLNCALYCFIGSSSPSIFPEEIRDWQKLRNHQFAITGPSGSVKCNHSLLCPSCSYFWSWSFQQRLSKLLAWGTTETLCLIISFPLLC